VIAMPKDKLPWKASDAKRLLRAVHKAGFANRRMSLSPDGTLTIEVAAPSPVEVSLDVSRDIDDIVENERAKWGDKGGKGTP
jgi:hypothetical protein